MIYEVAGDILLTKAEAIAHGVAPNDHFDHGRDDFSFRRLSDHEKGAYSS